MKITTEQARATLERIRTGATTSGGADIASDVELLIAYFVESEKTLLGAVDLLDASKNAFRSKQVEKARKLLQELL